MKANLKNIGTTKIIVYSAIGLVVLVGSYFGIVKPILKKMGVIDDKVDKEALKLIEEANKSDYWRQDYYKNNPKNISFNDIATDTTQLAEDLNKGVDGFLGTEDESLVLSVFRTLKTKEDLSYLVAIYKKEYNKDVLQDIIKELNSKELVQVFTITEKLK